MERYEQRNSKRINEPGNGTSCEMVRAVEWYKLWNGTSRGMVREYEAGERYELWNGTSCGTVREYGAGEQYELRNGTGMG